MGMHGGRHSVRAPGHLICGLSLERLQRLAEQAGRRLIPAPGLVEEVQPEEELSYRDRVRGCHGVAPRPTDVVVVAFDDPEGSLLLVAERHQRLGLGCELGEVRRMALDGRIPEFLRPPQVGLRVLPEQLMDRITAGVAIEDHERLVGQPSEAAH